MFESVLNQSLLAKARELLEKRTPFAFVTVIKTSGSAPREIGASMLVASDGKTVDTIGGGYAEFTAIEEALKAIKEGKPRLLEIDLSKGLKGDSGAICGGSLSVFIDVMKSSDTVFIFGGGHVGYAVARLAKFLRFGVVVVDERKDFANRERFPDADDILAEDYGTALDRLSMGKESYLVIVTPSHEKDEFVLRRVLGSSASYVGMIGSKTKVATIMARLRQEGFSEENLKRVRAPIGVEIAAETPEEIAVSIMGEIIQTRNTMS
ncbi:MAG TPA: XdhC/CoxI family protein [Candidatus Bathyarchaeia archaeon]|nr:XdhC/CoxI family protein [Candidatus Bathyarchaeia archaeon]